MKFGTQPLYDLRSRREVVDPQLWLSKKSLVTFNANARLLLFLRMTINGHACIKQRPVNRPETCSPIQPATIEHRWRAGFFRYSVTVYGDARMFAFWTPHGAMRSVHASGVYSFCCNGTSYTGFVRPDYRGQRIRNRPAKCAFDILCRDTASLPRRSWSGPCPYNNR